jgi:hypothetical protein
MDAMDEEELPRLTLGLLRRADTMCPQRLAHEHNSSRKPSRLADAGFAVSNRITEDAILWHKGAVETDSTAIAFPEPTDLSPEQCAYYNALARGYRISFPERDVVVDDLGWSTDVEDLGIRLVGRVGIGLRHVDNSHELRVLRTAPQRSLVDDVELHFTVLRAEAWVDEFTLTITNLLTLENMQYDINVAERLPDARAWLAERLAVVQQRANRDRPILGADCRHCTCIPSCKKAKASV